MSHVFMFKFFFIRVIDFLFDFINHVLIDFLLFTVTFLVFKIILNHHDSFSFIVPCGFCWLLFNNLIWTFTTNKERLFESSINHHNVAFDSKETWIIFFLKIFKWMISLDVLLELFFYLIKIFLVFIEIFIFNILF